MISKNMILKLLRIWRSTGYSVIAVWYFVKYNYLSRNVERKGGFVFAYPKSKVLLSPKSKIELYGDLFIGIPAIRGSEVRSRFVMDDGGHIIVRKKLEFMEGCDVHIMKNGLFDVGSFHTNIDFEMLCGDSLHVGDEVIAGRHVRIRNYNGHQTNYSGYPLSAPIVINDNVWICTGCSINSGVTIGSGSVIADNSNVINDVSPNTFNQGNPSEMIASNITFEI